MMLYLGIDPGQSGAIAGVFESGEYFGCIRLRETDHDVSRWVDDVASIIRTEGGFALIEKVGAFPKQGRSSIFKFGESAGFLRGMLVAHGVPYEYIAPAKWQGDMKCRTRGNKDITKSTAQRLFPNASITHANADAILIAELCRRNNRGVKL